MVMCSQTCRSLHEAELSPEAANAQARETREKKNTLLAELTTSPNES